MYKKFLSLSLISLLVVSAVFGCSKSNRYVKCEGMIWNTVWHITYKGPESLKDSILPVFNEIGHSLSVFEKNSLVSLLNDSLEIIADDNLIKVYDESKRINKLSGGLFDPTVSPLVDAWGFGIGHTPSADTLAVDSILTFIGIDKTRKVGNKIVKDDIRTRFNFSAIAKGYGCDAVAQMLRRNGVCDYMVEIGGEIALSGISPAGTLWHIAVDSPVEGSVPGEESALVLALSDVGIATSGNYRNFRGEGAAKTAHTISPLSGRPYVSSILSATVVAGDCMLADGLATACMAGEVSQALDLLKEADAEGLLITSDSVFMSPGFSKYIVNKK